MREDVARLLLGEVLGHFELHRVGQLLGELVPQDAQEGRRGRDPQLAESLRGMRMHEIVAQALGELLGFMLGEALAARCGVPLVALALAVEAARGIAAQVALVGASGRIGEVGHFARRVGVRLHLEQPRAAAIGAQDPRGAHVAPRVVNGQRRRSAATTSSAPPSARPAANAAYTAASERRDSRCS